MSNKYLRGLLPVPLFGCSSCRNITGYEYREMAVLAVIVIILLLFIFLGIYSNVLRDGTGPRDTGSKKSDIPIKKEKNRQDPFSLVKVQFGLWTVIICSSYIYLSLCKGDCTEGAVNKTALVLLVFFRARRSPLRSSTSVSGSRA